MRITAFLLLFSVIQVFAGSSYSQNTRLSLNFKNAPIIKVLDEIEDQSEFFFLFNQKLVNVNRKVDIDVKNKKIKDILADLFTDDVSCMVLDRQILLSPKYMMENVNGTRDQQTQEKIVTGKVTDISGLPLPGVSIQVRGAITGTITDNDGNFSFSIPNNATTLVFSFVGMATQEVEIGTQTVFNVVMEELAIGLDEVIFVGYGTQRKVSLTGAIATVGSDELNAINVGDVVSRLQGRVTGLTITNNWRPGATATIRVRGYGSLGNNSPLFVVDGIPRTSMDNINPNDIESMTVLKDASSAAIYGTRGANGVILITTKRGKSGRTKLNLSVRRGFQYNTSQPDLMNSREVGEMLWQRFENIGLSPGDVGWGDVQYGYGSSPVMPDYIMPAGTVGTVDENTYTEPGIKPFNSIAKANKGDNLWSTLWTPGAPIEEYNLNLSGGSDMSVYSLTTSYYWQKGIHNFEGDDINDPTKNGYKRYSLRSNNDVGVTDWLKFSPNIYAQYSEQLGTTSSGTGSGILDLHPILPVYDISNNFAGSKIPNVGNGRNPVASLVRNKDDYIKAILVQASASVQASFTKELIFKSLIGVNYRSSFSKNRTLADPEFNQTKNTASLSVNSGTNFQYNWTNTLNYMKTIGNNHNINVLAGMEVLDQMSESVSGSRSVFAFEDIDYMVLDAGEADMANSHSGSQSRLFSYFVRINYDYQGKYLFEGVIRRDASSRFTGDYRWGTFPAFSAGWRLSEESFLQDVSWLSNLKLRGGWGQNGNDNVGNYNAYSTFMSYDRASYYNISGASRNSVASGFSINRIGNPEARWETGTSTNIGVDVSLFESKLEGSLDIFDRRTVDMLYTDTRPLVWGLVRLPDINIGEMKNTGFDLMLTYRGSRVESDLYYSASLTLSHFKNEVIKLNNNPDEIRYGFNTEAGNSSATTTGQPIDAFYGYVFEGFFNTQSEIDAWPKYNPNVAGVDGYSQLGVMKFKDVNGDGIITPDDRTFLGDGYPDLSYGFNFELRYKNWDMNLFFQGLYGRDIIKNFERVLLFVRQEGNYLRKRLYESWTPERYAAGEKITVPMTILKDSQMQLPSSFFLAKGDYVRLKDIQIGYKLPSNVLSKFRIDDFRIFIQAINLFTITKYDGLNPEVNDKGYDSSVYPTPRIFNIGINLSL